MENLLTTNFVGVLNTEMLQHDVPLYHYGKKLMTMRNLSLMIAKI